MEEGDMEKGQTGNRVLDNCETTIREKRKRDRIKPVPSITEANRPRGHGVGLWGNPRIVVGVRLDSGLYGAFKPVAKAKFGSVCRPIECFMVAILACSNETVNLGNTVKIESLHIERNLRSRRALEFSDVGVEKVGEGGVCFQCKKAAVLFYRVQCISGLVVNLCSDCLNDYQQRTVVKRVLGKAGNVHG